MNRFFLTLIMAFSHSSWTQNIETLWRARGIEAKENIEDLIGKKTALDECKKSLEISFSEFSNPKSPAIIQMTDKDNERGFLLYLKSKSGKSTSVTFTYKGSIDEPYMITPIFYDAASADGWSFVIMPSWPSGSFSLQSAECVYHFFVNDYLHPKVEATLSKKTLSSK
jgi:hypothetical protein